jgi:hypothetical protein
MQNPSAPNMPVAQGYPVAKGYNVPVAQGYPVQVAKQSYTSRIKSGFSSLKTSVTSIFKTDLWFFIKYYFYFILLFSICFYLLISVENRSRNKTVKMETKVFFYFIIIILFFVISDILDTPLEQTNKFILTLIFMLAIVYICDEYIYQNYKSKRFSKTILINLILIIVFVLYFYFVYYRSNKDESIKLFNTLNHSILKNYNLILFTMIILFIYKITYHLFNWNTNITDVLQPAFLAGILIFYIFSFIIYLCLKLKIVNRTQILNSFISLFAIFIFLMCIFIHLLMSSISSICDNNNYDKSVSKEKEMFIILMIVSIIIILWLDDTRNWNQIGSILFVFASIIAFYTFFVYTMKYPDLGLISFWLFVEWCILFSYRKENSKNSIHFSFMKF